MPTSPTYTFRMLSFLLTYGGEKFVKNESKDSQQEGQEGGDRHFEIHRGSKEGQSENGPDRSRVRDVFPDL